METQPRKRDADRSRADILDAAERLFAARGFDVVTMAEIGAAAGLSRGTPGYFFGHKEQLYRVVLERAAATFRMLGETLRLRDAGGQRDPATVLRETIEAFVGLLVARSDVVKLLDRDGGTTVGAPHIEAINDALSALGPGRGPVALTVATLAWYPISHPEAARALGVDAQDPQFVARWSAHIFAVAAATLSGTTPAGVSADQSVDPDARFVTEVVIGEKRKKKKKKKKGLGDA
jgi:AcrR family transcriptional regulator